MKNKVRGFWSSLKKTIAVLTGRFDHLTLEEVRECFKEASSPAERKFGKLQNATPAWERCFYHWLNLCESKESCMGPFFASFEFGYRDSMGSWMPNPLREAAAMKWLAFISVGSITPKDRAHIWNLSNNHWGQGCRTQSHLVANALRDKIARERIADARDQFELTDAIGYASSEEVMLLGVARRKEMEQAKSDRLKARLGKNAE